MCAAIEFAHGLTANAAQAGNVPGRHQHDPPEDIDVGGALAVRSLSDARRLPAAGDGHDQACGTARSACRKPQQRRQAAMSASKSHGSIRRRRCGATPLKRSSSARPASRVSPCSSSASAKARRSTPGRATPITSSASRTPADPLAMKKALSGLDLPGRGSRHHGDAAAMGRNRRPAQARRIPFMPAEGFDKAQWEPLKTDKLEMFCFPQGSASPKCVRAPPRRGRCASVDGRDRAPALPGLTERGGGGGGGGEGGGREEEEGEGREGGGKRSATTSRAIAVRRTASCVNALM